ncbi:sugar transporter-like protein [Arabidopsis thaliana]|nr:sugar transporter-like protein [Arabidopsis thaliana]
MQSSTYAVKGNAAFAFQRRTFSSDRSTTSTGIRFAGYKSLATTGPLYCSGSEAMGATLARADNGIQSVMSFSSVKARSVRAQASSDGDEEEAIPLRSEGKSSGTVLPFVGVACLGAILFGYHLGVVNGALEYLAKDLGIAENTVLQGKYMMIHFFTPPVNGWIVSSLLAGATVGSFTGGALADKFGRTRTFQLDAIPLAIGAFLCATAQSVQTMIVGRLLAGIGIGISSAIVPLYISEISPTEIRGALGSVNQLFICIGILAALIAGLPLAANPLWWRTMFGVAVIPSVLLAIGMAFSPESPRWLVQQGKVSEAEKAIKTLYGKERVVELVRDLSASGQGSSEPEAGWFDLFSSRYWKVVSVGAALFLFQQLAGINAVVYYSTSVFRSAGIQSDVAASALVGASNVFGTAVASSLMDKMGRKSLLLTSFGGMALSMLLLSLSFTWKALAAYSGTLAVVGTVLYVLSFSLGAGPVPALLLPEIFASRIRAKAVALSLGMHWISNFVIGLYFLSVVTKFGISSVYLGFAGVCVLAVLYIAGNVVETKGRSLEEIELALTSGA